MNTLVTSILLCSLCAGASVAGAPPPSNDPADINAIKKLEQDMGDAMVRVDTNRLGQIYADDFATVGSSGKIITKKELLGDFEAFHDKLVSFENGPVEVQVFGNLAVAHSSVAEKRIRDGKDVSGEFVWMDLLEKRAGKWVVLRSVGSRMK
ncbi:MAG TPA: nuclear transport factor 2 family protein [Steroidobacteraceae bacterium]|nr:nuclear transport factor 2 family protein [Steroidobacteraceae bacterium]